MDMLSLNGSVRFRTEANGSAIAFLGDAIYFLNPSAAFILKACEKFQSVERVARGLREEFEVNSSIDVEYEVRVCLGELVGYKLLRKRRVRQEEYDQLHICSLSLLLTQKASCHESAAS